MIEAFVQCLSSLKRKVYIIQMKLDILKDYHESSLRSEG